MDMNFSGDSNQDYYPWKCVCGRINKKWHTECAICFAPWTQGTRHPTQPKTKKQESYGWSTYGWDDWEKWEEDRSRSSSRASSRHHFGATDQAYATYPSSSQMPTKAKGNSKGKKGKQGKSQSKQNDQMSPFQAEPKSFAPWTTLDTSAFTPSTTLSPNPFAAASSSLVAQDQEWVEALKRAYPDPALMPEETKLLVEKAEKTHGRKGIKKLHQATTYLGKVKDHLSEVSDHRRAHRALWMKHMAAGIQIWEQQLDEFRKHQAFLTEQASKARQEITATSRIIQQLSHTAGGTSAPPPLTVVTAEVEEHTEDAADKEEETLRTNLQAVLRNCAGSLGLDIEPPKAVEVVEEVEAVDGDKPPKRQRSLEPFGGKPSS